MRFKSNKNRKNASATSKQSTCSKKRANNTVDVNNRAEISENYEFFETSSIKEKILANAQLPIAEKPILQPSIEIYLKC